MTPGESRLSMRARVAVTKPSGAHHFRLAHLRFALMMTARAQPTTGRGGADGGDGG